MRAVAGFLPGIDLDEALRDAQDDTIRVRIDASLSQAWVEGERLRVQAPMRDEWKPALKADGAASKTALKLECGAHSVRVGDVRWNVRDHGPLLGATSDLSRKSAEPVRVRGAQGALKLDGRRLKGTLLIYPAREGTACEIAVELPLETYLEGVVASEFNTRWDENAVSAQAIAARTYAYYQKRRARANPFSRFDVEATVQDQVYALKERDDPIAKKIVHQTRGMVLSANGEESGVLKAFYHSTCGGGTELPQAVWGNKVRGFDRSRPCPYCKASPRYAWELTVSTAELVQAVERRGPASRLAPSLLAIRVLSLTPSGRASELLVRWREGSSERSRKIDATELRARLGATRLLSTRFEVNPVMGEPAVRFRGTGYGHGVGLCQYGAKAMGEQGRTAAQILAYYYPDAKLIKLW